MDDADIDSIEEQVHLWTSQCLNVAHPGYLPTTDEDTEGEQEVHNQLRRKHRSTSGKLRNADTTVINQILWPHELVYTSSGQPAMYEDLSCMAFVNGYLSLMGLQ